MIPSRLAEHDGAFAWWYLDTVDADGRGMVCIFAFALPFLPGLMADARAGRMINMLQRPSVNVALYEGGRCTSYLLQEFGRSDVTWQSDASETTVTIGNNRLCSRVKGTAVEVDVDLNLDVKRVGSIVGTVQVRGLLPVSSHTVATPTSPDGHSDHRWDWQAAHAMVTADLHVSGVPWRCSSRGYHDQNSGPEPLANLGISRWLWGRLAGADGALDAVVYALWRDGSDLDGPASECTLVRVHEGVMAQRPATMIHRLAKTWLGMPRAMDVDVHGDGMRMRATATSCVDKGPFYTRSLWRGDVDGRAAHGVVEVVDPHRIDIGWQRPFVNMRVAGPERSMFLPLFSGPSSGRWSRFLGLG